MKCLTAEMLNRYLDGEDPGLELKRLREHLETCPACRALAREVLSAVRLGDVLAALEPGAGCPGREELLAGAVAGSSFTLNQHLAACPECMARFEAMVSLLGWLEELEEDNQPSVPEDLDRRARSMISHSLEPIWRLKLILENAAAFPLAAEEASGFGRDRVLRLPATGTPVALCLEAEPPDQLEVRISGTQGPGGVSLQLTLRSNGMPLADSPVELVGAVEASGRTDREGKVSFSGLGPGECRLRIENHFLLALQNSR